MANLPESAERIARIGGLVTSKPTRGQIEFFEAHDARKELQESGNDVPGYQASRPHEGRRG
jgi:hypothetical protein